MTEEPILQVAFFCSETGREPVREWLKELAADDRKAIGEDIKLVQFRWPLGMPLVEKLDANLWEVRSRLQDGRIACACFTVRAGKMVLLHGFMKKTQKMPLQELELARRRRDLWWSR